MVRRATKSISLTPEQAEFVDEKVQSGQYQSASEVVRDGLRALQDREAAMDEVRKKIAGGLEQLDRGETVTGEQLIENLKERSRDVRSRKG